EHAAAIARHLGTEHTELYLTAADSLTLVPRLPDLYDEPFADPSQLPTFLVSQLARQRVTVALTGDGGDELFAGYSAYSRSLKQWDTWRRLPAGMRGGIADIARAAAESPWLAGRGRRTRKLAAKLADRAGRMRGATPVAMLAGKRSACDRPEALVPGGRALPTVLSDPALVAAVDDPLLAMQQVDIEGYLTDDILVKVDRASMAVALEVRCPLLDWRIVEFALSLPPSMRLGPGGGKQVLRTLLARHVPPALWDRPKAGFGIPVAEWLRGPLRDWAESLLDERRLRDGGLLAAQPVRRLWAQHLAGTHNHERLLWSLLMFQAWHARWCTGAAPRIAA
ncbi:MAG TPA: asparagine synthase C-terminal domain-containing protein, partial [Rhodospirillales bacterium]|nr:asparagine synthase C-terminal domain-containing protein [Rhodospirillales bacterium]